MRKGSVISTRNALRQRSPRGKHGTPFCRARRYHDWVTRWVQRVEDADNRGNTKAVYDGVAALAAKSRKRFTKQPTRKKTKTNDSKTDKNDWDSMHRGGPR